MERVPPASNHDPGDDTKAQRSVTGFMGDSCLRIRETTK